MGEPWAAGELVRGRTRALFVVYGAGGVGKSTLARRLLGLRGHLWLSRSWTTRPRRPSEPREAYVYATREEFMARVAAGGFVEWTEFAGNGHLYGTPTLDAPEGDDVVLEIDVDGASQVRQRYPDAVLVLVVAPSREAQAEQLQSRGDDDESVQRRLELGAEEERLGRKMADHVVVNDDLERASRQLAAIIDAYRRDRSAS
ncbi:MAG: guanylate kinase [Acidimicrobiales bacterium]